jgi:hypothetical protein
MLTNDTNLTQTQIENVKKCFEVMAGKQFLTNPLGGWQNAKISSIIFSYLLPKHNAKKRLKKDSVEKSCSPLKIGRRFEFPTPF